LAILRRFCPLNSKFVNIPLDVNKIVDSPISSRMAKYISEICPNVVSLWLIDFNFELLKEIFHNLEKLCILISLNTNFCFQDLSHKSFHNLKILILRGGRINIQLKHNVSFPNLEVLDLSETFSIDDSFTSVISNCPSLKTIDLRQTNVTSDFILNWFDPSSSRKATRDVYKPLNLLCERIVWERMIIVQNCGKLCKSKAKDHCEDCEDCEDCQDCEYHNKVHNFSLHSEEVHCKSPCFVFQYKSWTVGIEESFWYELDNSDTVYELWDESCWCNWFPKDWHFFRITYDPEGRD